MNDLRYALRMLFKSPGFTAVAVLSLGLGIGANTTVFCWIENVLLRPLSGVKNCEQLVALTATHGAVTYDTVSLPDIKDYAQLTEVFSGIIGSQITPVCISLDGKPSWAYGQIATANFFDLLGVQPILGRTFLPSEDQQPGGNTVLVISYGYWQRRFGGNRDIIGTSVELNQHSFTIIGVAPPAFYGTMGGLNCDFWAPISMHHEVANFGSLTVRRDRWLHTQARLRPGVSTSRAQAAVNIESQRLEKAYPNDDREIGLRLLPLWKAPYGAQSLMLPVLRILMVVSFGVLLIVAVNVANLLLARATTRAKEIAIRLSLGAQRVRLIRQLLTESVVLALLGGAVGILFANWGVSLFRGFMPRTHLPLVMECPLDSRTLIFTLLLAVGTGIIFGLVPAWQASRSDLNRVLKEGGRASGAPASNHRLRSVFVVSEVALALLLLVGAGLCIKGLHRARQVDMGFDPQNVLVTGLRIGMNGYDQTNGLVFYRQLHQRISTLPGVDTAALATWFPLGFEGGPSLGVDPEGYARKPNEDMSVPYAIVSPHYFDVMRIPILAGRDFRDSDEAGSLKVAIINETMAQRFWPGQSPLGRKFNIWRGDVTIVGVVKSGKYRSLNESPRCFLFLPYQQGVWDLNLGVALRTTGNPQTMVNTLREAIHGLDPRVEIWAGLTMVDYIKPAFLAQGITATLLTALGAVALILAAMGIYGVMAYVVSQRTQEIGIRVALGASVPDVLRLIVGQGMTLGAWGIVCGLAGALLVTRLLATFLYGVSPFDPVTFAAVSGVLALVVLMACLLPACRAARVDPQIALRYE
jgi:predicted permease